MSSSHIFLALVACPMLAACGSTYIEESLLESSTTTVEIVEVTEPPERTFSAHLDVIDQSLNDLSDAIVDNDGSADSREGEMPHRGMPAQSSHDTSPRRPPSAVINRASSTCTSYNPTPRPSSDLFLWKTRAASRRRPARFSRRFPFSICWPVGGARCVDGVEVASFPPACHRRTVRVEGKKGPRGAGRRAGDEDDDVPRARRRHGLHEGAALDLGVPLQRRERVLQ